MSSQRQTFSPFKAFAEVNTKTMHSPLMPLPAIVPPTVISRQGLFNLSALPAFTQALITRNVNRVRCHNRAAPKGNEPRFTLSATQ